jgi:hypothetical protein
VSEANPYVILKQLVWEAYQRVKANRGPAGVDGESLAAFEKDLKGIASMQREKSKWRTTRPHPGSSANWRATAKRSIGGTTVDEDDLLPLPRLGNR